MTLIVATKDAVYADMEINDGTPNIMLASKIACLDQKVVATTGDSRACAVMMNAVTNNWNLTHNDPFNMGDYIGLDKEGTNVIGLFRDQNGGYYLWENSFIGTELFFPSSGFLFLGSLASDAARIAAYHGCKPETADSIFNHLALSYQVWKDSKISTYIIK